MPTILGDDQYLYPEQRGTIERLTLHGVLDGCSSQKQAITALEAEQCLPPGTGRVFDILRLVEDHILPLDALEVLLVLSDLHVLVSTSHYVSPL